MSGWIAENEDGIELAFRGRYAARILAMEDIYELFGKLKMLFFNADAVSYYVNGNVGVDIAQHVEIDFDGRIDFNYILPAHIVAAHILDDGHGAIQLIKVQIVVDIHAFSGLNVVEHNAVLDAVNIHVLSPFAVT